MSITTSINTNVRAHLMKFCDENPNVPFGYSWEEIANMEFYELCSVLMEYMDVDQIKDIIHDVLKVHDGYNSAEVSYILDNEFYDHRTLIYIADDLNRIEYYPKHEYEDLSIVTTYISKSGKSTKLRRSEKYLDRHYGFDEISPANVDHYFDFGNNDDEIIASSFARDAASGLA